ncbi:hypothetical protein SCORR_v1c04280 [Spiroplasma corruscae]|uniref:J domain-containing protein n=1 Tax=Spiroplasma corruscae TaxID=216934 RepID=A0A222ENZ9_9MOLU|nr:hypothetical protein [Spiroplasma corruscae]ASP28202.1 hypothetical protein SCORR_v1c04280 [Spiroplasma corruscae]
MSESSDKKINKEKRKINKIFRNITKTNVDDYEDVNQDDESVGFLDYDDEIFEKIHFNKYSFINNRIKEEDSNFGYLEYLSNNFYNKTREVYLHYNFLKTIDIKSFKIKLNNHYFSINRFPCLISQDNLKILLNNYKNLDDFTINLIKACVYKFTYFIHKTVTYGINENIVNFNNYIKNKILIKDTIKIVEFYLNDLYINLFNELNNPKVDFKHKYYANYLLNHSFIISNYNHFVKWYKIYLDNFVNRYNINNINNEISSAFSFFKLDDDASYEDFKLRYRSLSKKFHPDSLGVNNEEEILKVNYYKLILESYFKNN